jgi:pteridine reductase
MAHFTSEERVALVTGAGKRIGRRIASRLAETGVAVAVHVRSSISEGESLVNEIESAGGRAKAYVADFAAPRAADELAAAVLGDFGRCDLLVNNAAIWPRGPIDWVTGEEFDRVIAVNLRSPFLLALPIAREMKRRGSGAIVNILDWSHVRPYADQVPYAISKAGLAAATTGLARALAPEVRVNGIAPGPILLSDDMDSAAVAEVLRAVPMGRLGNPDDIADAVVYLAQASYVTGVILNVDGGRALR